MKEPLLIQAVTIPDAWFQALYNVFDDRYVYSQYIDRGSYEGQTRRQFAHFSCAISRPWEDMIVKMPESSSLPPPTDQKYIDDYFAGYLMRAELESNEEYTYGERIAESIEQVIWILKHSPGTNQAVIEIGQPADIELPDPPCLRVMTFKVIEGVLSLGVFFRSWDLWGGFPSNLPGFELLKQYIAGEAGLENGPMHCFSDGLHIYGMQEEVARMRVGK